MKKLLFLALICAILCSCTPNDYQVMRLDGQIIWADNRGVRANIDCGDTCIIATFPETGSVKIYGYYIGVMPTMYEDVKILYEKAIVIK